jgi:predicted membrane GTPase involved in stress response
MSLEDALEYIGEEELMEITPESIRLRKKYPRTQYGRYTYVG